MKRVLTKILAGVLVVGGLVAVLWPVPNWRMYDANWQPLAMTEAESYCAGWVFANTQKNEPQPEAMADCIAEKTDFDNETPRIGTSVRYGCLAFETVTTYPTAECIQIFEGNGLWWLKDGGFTWEWNDSNARPQVIQNDIINAPRREGRTEDNRDGTERLGE